MQVVILPCRYIKKLHSPRITAAMQLSFSLTASLGAVFLLVFTLQPPQQHLRSQQQEHTFLPIAPSTK